MTFPRITYNYNDLDEARALTDVIETKFSSLTKYFHENQTVTCDVEFVKIPAQQNGPIHTLRVNLIVDGTLFRAEATEESFEQSIDEARAELDKELRRSKDKQATLHKQAGREAKEKMLEAE